MKQTVARAKLQWLSFGEGGRKVPPTGPRYTTVCRFEEDANNWLKTGWSLVVDFDSPLSESLEQSADVWFLFYDKPDCPQYLLHIGSRFDLMEGKQIVASGHILEILNA